MRDGDVKGGAAGVTASGTGIVVRGGDARVLAEAWAMTVAQVADDKPLVLVLVAFGALPSLSPVFGKREVTVVLAACVVAPVLPRRRSPSSPAIDKGAYKAAGAVLSVGGTGAAGTTVAGGGGDSGGGDGRVDVRVAARLPKFM